jgi:hypothetical protein
MSSGNVTLMHSTLLGGSSVSRQARRLFFMLLASALALRAELSPEAYQQMQNGAPEQLAILVTDVVKTPQADGLQVNATATVIDVEHSASGLSGGNLITLSYVQVPLRAGTVGPAPVSVVVKGVTYTAYLQGGPPPSTYLPVAQGQSFIIQKDWPTPTNVLPKGWVDSGKKSIQITQNGTQYFVDVGAPVLHIPLLTAGGPPVVLHYYQSSADTPNVQVLVYVAGTVASKDPTGAPLTVERAVIITNPANVAVGDALWAVNAPGVPQPPQPIWNWTADKLTVINLYEKTIQTITLKPNKK